MSQAPTPAKAPATPIAPTIPVVGATLGEGVVIGAGAVIGLQPLATSANRRPVHVDQPKAIIGARTVIGAQAVIYANVIVGEDCRFGDHATVREEVRIGARCIIGSFVDIQYGALIGDDVRILNQSQIAGGSLIGNGSFIGPGVQTANHRHVDLDNYDNPPEGLRPPIIGRKVMIGVGAILLPGVHIGDGATINAGALVTRDVPAGETWQGFPARKLDSFAFCERCVTRSACRDRGSCLIDSRAEAEAR